MSTLKVNNLQVGQHATATNNFTLYQPAVPDGTVRLGYGNVGSVTDSLTFTNTGRLGIGVTNPESLFHINGDATALRISRGSAIGFVYNTGTSATAPFRIQSNGGSVDLYSVAGQPITFSAGGTEKARVDGSGNVGIGVTNPDSLLHLKSTSGNVRHTIEVPDTFQAFTNYSAANSEFSIGYIRNSGSDHSFRFCAADGLSSGEIMRIDSVNQRVGIGTTNPSQKLDIIGGIKLQGSSIPNSLVSSIIYKNFNSTGYDIVQLDARTGANIYEGVLIVQTRDVSGVMSERLQIASDGTMSLGTSTKKQKLTVNGDIGIYKGPGQTRVFTVKGDIGTFSTLTVTVNQYDYGCFVYDLKVHGYAGSYLHYAGGAYENGGIYNPVTTIAQKSPSATITGPTWVSGHTWRITVTYASAWVHPVAEFSVSGGGYFMASESDITMVWS